MKKLKTNRTLRLPSKKSDKWILSTLDKYIIYNLNDLRTLILQAPQQSTIIIPFTPFPHYHTKIYDIKKYISLLHGIQTNIRSKSMSLFMRFKTQPTEAQIEHARFILKLASPHNYKILLPNSNIQLQTYDDIAMEI